VGKTHWWPAADTFGFEEAALTIDTHLTPELGRADAYIRFLEERGLFTYNAATWTQDRPRLHPPELPEDALKVNWTGSAACGMLDGFARQDAPFFLFCSFVEPHGAGSVTDAALDAIRDISLPPRIPPGGRNKPAFLEQAAAGWEGRRSPEKIEAYRHGVAASLRLVDTNVGRLLQRVDDLGLRDSTVVVFLTDHGDFCHDHGFIEKTIPYEPAINIPFLMAGPGIEPGSEREELVSQIDLMPTLLDYANDADPSARLEGRSLRRLAQGDAVPWRDAIFCECDATVHLRGAGLDVQSAQAKTVRQGPWKYTYWIVNGREIVEELYELDTDPEERDNLAQDQEHRVRCETLRSRILDWLIVTETDRLEPAQENTYPVPQPGPERR
jgi:arylsulfatase A-like enzyme